MQYLAVSGQTHTACAINRGANILFIDLTRTAAKTDATATVNAANMRSADADAGPFDGAFGDGFGTLHRKTNGSGSFIEFDNLATAHAFGFGNTMTAIAQYAIDDLAREAADALAAHIEHGDQSGFSFYRYRFTAHVQLHLAASPHCRHSGRDSRRSAVHTAGPPRRSGETAGAIPGYESCTSDTAYRNRRSQSAPAPRPTDLPLFPLRPQARRHRLR